jgi:serine/threonine protein kinase/WD40 repeat protein/tetratricopeptide (TPR) repeat protein
MAAPKPDESTLFNAARRIDDLALRQRYIREMCGDDRALAERIEALLRAHGDDRSFLTAATQFDDVPLAEATGEGAGTKIGPYTLIRLLGAGGMGTVFVAEQTEPVKRQVALKLIQPGLDSRQVLTRFEAERQALALMDHPHIAKVLDAGTTANHRPYFVMELIDGVPITEYCDRERLSVRRRLELFVPVCQAVQHAHQKGVIHRDLKPSNVLVALYDGVPVPKIIDFGVAKATAAKLTDKTLVTEFGWVVGTLEYMSPEQADLGQVDIDTRSDIYSLGVLLYQLLTGTTPLRGEQLRGVPLWDALQNIREEDPPRLSARLNATEELNVMAAQRAVEPKKLVRLVRGDLEWIVMKCLEKDRTRRYETANALARDIERYVNHEPVEACPPSPGYRLRKFAHRHRAALATACAFVLLLLAATLISTWQAIRATLAETKAQQERQQAVTNLYHARVEEAAALRRARGMGYRAEVFHRLRQALELDTPDKDSDRLRDEAVACLGDFVGLEPIIWEDFPATIQKVALTPDGEQMAIALDNGTVRLHSVSTGDLVAQRSEAAVDLGMDPEKRWLVTTAAKGTIKVWPDYGLTGAPAEATLEMGADCAGLARNGRFAVAVAQQKDGGLLSLWDVARREVKARFKVPVGQPEGRFQVSDDGQWVAQAYTHQGKLYTLVWNTPIPEPKKVLVADTNDTEALAISPKGGFLACQHGDDGLLLLDVQQAMPRPLIRDNQVMAAGFSGDGRFLVCFSLGGRVRLWNVSKHEEVASLAHPDKGGQRETFLTTFSADGNTFATALRANRSIRIWKLAGSGEKLVLAGHEGGVPCVAFSPDGQELASGSKDRWVKFWDTATGRLLRTLPRFDYPIQSLAYSPDGRLLATGQYESTAHPVTIWDLATLQALPLADDELGGWAAGVAFSPDGKFFAASGQGLTIWRLAQGAPRVSLERMTHLPGQRSISLCISPNSQRLAWVDDNYSVCLWDLANGREDPFPGPPLEHGWHNLTFYPDSDHLTFGAVRKMNETWDTRTTRRVSRFGQVGHVAASPDGRWLATSEPGLWSAQTGTRVFALPQENGPIWYAASSPDGQRLAFALADGGLMLWNVPRIQDQLAGIGLAWRAQDRAPPQEAQPFEPATPNEQKHHRTQYANLGKRLAWVGRFAEAEQAYRAPLQLLPRDAEAHGNLGKFLADQARHAEAAAEFSTAIQEQPQHSSFWVQRGWAHADLGQWDKAAADFVQATKCKEPDAEAWSGRALLHLRDGDQDGYRQICADMLERFGAAAVWTCTLTPNSGAEPARLVALADRACAKSSRDHWHVNPHHGDVHRLGAALYRAGRCEEAVQRLTDAAALNAHPYRTNVVCTWFFLAMAHQHLGHNAEARGWLEKASRATEDALKAPEKFSTVAGTLAPNWARRLTLQLLRREAEQLLGMAKDPAPGTNDGK